MQRSTQHALSFAARGILRVALPTVLLTGVAFGAYGGGGRLLGPVACADDSGCPVGERCRGGRSCQPIVRGSSGAPCLDDRDCLTGLGCSERKVCRPDGLDWCRPRHDCAEHGSCPNEGCWLVNESTDSCIGAAPSPQGDNPCAAFGLCELDRNRCVARTDAQCSGSWICRVLGRCSARDGECVVATSLDCLRSDACAKSGRCWAVSGDCAALPTEQTCARSAACKSSGHCQLRDGRCVADRPADCRASADCKECGRCTLDDAECVARTDADCAGSHNCWNYGRCAASEGRCVAASAAGCKASWVCHVWGRCSLGEEGECVVGSDEDCRGSRRCTTDGECRLAEGRCVGSAPPEPGGEGTGSASRAPSHEGEPSAAPAAECPGPVADPEFVEARRRADEGEPPEPEWYKTCETWDWLCWHDGRCSWDGERCAVTSDGDCRKSDECLKRGRCRAAAGRCVDGMPTRAECRASPDCAQRGECSAVGPFCVVGSNDDCVRSRRCAGLGQCTAIHPGTVYGACVASSDRECARAAVCAKQKRCTAHASGSCSDATDRPAGEVAPPMRSFPRARPEVGMRAHRCDEPLPEGAEAPAVGPLSPVPRPAVRAVGRDAEIETLGLYVHAPSFWVDEQTRWPTLVADPASLASLGPDEARGPFHFRLPLTALDPVLPWEACILLAIDRDWQMPVPTVTPELGEYLHSLRVAVYAVAEPVDLALGRLERLLRWAAHDVGCSRRQLYMQRDWPSSRITPWHEWRDLQRPWKTVGVQALSQSAGHIRSHWIEVRARRFGATTLVVALVGEGDPSGIPLGELLPRQIAERPGSAPPSPRQSWQGSSCVLSPLDDTQYALGPGPGQRDTGDR